jgi:hypothetical protein
VNIITNTPTNSTTQNFDFSGDLSTFGNQVVHAGKTLQNFSIDSTKIRIPINEVEIKNPLLNNDFIVVCDSTGEVLDGRDFKKSSLQISKNGIKSHYRIEKQVAENQGIETYLTILFSSKTLGSHYFQGITKDTIDIAYNHLMCERSASFSYDSFLNGELTDIDVKSDFILNVPATHFVNQLYQDAPAVKKSINGCAKYAQAENCGMQYSLRKTTQPIKSPYLKFYEKVRELTYKSHEFKKAYLDNIKLPSELMRAETNIKNKKHLKHLGATENNMRYFLSNIDDIAVKAFKNAFESHKIFEFNNAQNVLAEQVNNLNLNDRGFATLLMERYLQSQNITTAITSLLDFITSNKSERYKLSMKLNRICKILDFSKINDSRLKTDIYGCLRF